MTLSLTVGTITSFVILLLISNGVVSDLRRCCEKGTLIPKTMTCSEGTLFLKCTDIRQQNHEDFSRKYEIKQQNNEVVSIKERETGYTLPLDEVCIEFTIHLENGKAEIYSEYLSCDPDAGGLPVELYLAAITSMSIISSSLLFITAFVYFFIPQTQDVEGKCIFHFALILSFCHSWFPYRAWVENRGILSEFCITETYLMAYAILSSFSWSSVLSFHTWSRFRKTIRLDQSKLMFQYLLFGYGFPGVLILLAFIHTHAISLSRNSSLQWRCSKHQNEMIIPYTLIPWFIIQLTNIVLFVKLQKQLWNVHPSNSREQASFMKKFKFKFMMNLRLFVIMGLPWWIIILSEILGHLTTMFVFFEIILVMGLIICCQGIFILGIMVVGRKRVRQGIAEKFGLLKCKPNADVETSIESDVANKNDEGQELETRAENGK